MKIIRRISCVLSLLVITILAGCATTSPAGPPPPNQQEILELAQVIRALGDDVDPEEADRAAHIAYEYPLQLAQEYQITDSALIHNMKVNNGTRPRGLCWHWAQDMETRLKQENFQTLDLHRAIANSNMLLRIDHSTVIVSSRGDTMYEGLVLDPWRYSGELHWTPPREDSSYAWRPREEVLAEKRERMVAQNRSTNSISVSTGQAGN
ncbi:hypothetical protein ACFFUT_07510 [Pseudohalocynthiibacter aestuariivivens]|uniref:Lipoprotein n=1 Tax=Pseudohalocynthiibacter aestuariivivens TaxID=1591409 RepID=A0ABV5JFH4_9RHOB|nr:MULTISPECIES: hypothetical protein [Pseudohalocynthiibacter]MBS9718037.1 hypothetical protein [Pseudohalocynthiibacter aestuariivivens]